MPTYKLLLRFRNLKNRKGKKRRMFPLLNIKINIAILIQILLQST